MKWVDGQTLKYLTIIQQIIYKNLNMKIIEFGGDGTVFNFGPSPNVLVTDKRIELTTDLPTEIIDFDISFSHLGGFDLGICCNAIYYAKDPLSSLENMLGTIKYGGDLIVTVPWFYPHHDLAQNQWRIHPNILLDSLSPHFKRVSAYGVGRFSNLPSIYFNRTVRNFFPIWPSIQEFRSLLAKCSTEEDFRTELKLRRHSPLWVIIHASGRI